MTTSNPLATVEFHGQILTIHDHQNQQWFAGIDIGRALGYDDPEKINEVYRRHRDEFDESMTCTLSLGGAGGQRRTVRVFNRDGGRLLTMFSRTSTAKDLRKLILRVLKQHLDTPYIEHPGVRPGQAENLRREREEADSLPPPEMVLLLKSNLKVKDQVISSLKDELLQSLRFQVHTLSRPKRHRPRARPLSKEEIGQIHALHAQGFSVGGIGRRLARSHATVSFVLRGAGVGAQAAAGVAS